jgi:hypothetical protein
MAAKSFLMAKEMKSQALLVCALAVLSGHVVAFQNEPTEFRGIKWGEDFSVHATEMTLLQQSKGGTKWYRRKNEKMSFGDAKLSQLMYGYHNGKFFVVFMETSGARNRRTITKEFISRFGKPDQSLREGDYVWGKFDYDSTKETRKGTDTQVTLSCGYKIKPLPGAEDDCYAQVVSNKLSWQFFMAKLKRDEEKAARAYGARCPTATKVKAESKGRYTEVIEANGLRPRPYRWIFNDRQGWAIFHDTKYDNDYFANRAGFLAVRKSTIRKTLVEGDLLSMLAPYFGKIDKPTWHEDQYGRPIFVQRYEAIYPKGCDFFLK